jgi:hypothetical protein
MKYYKLSSSLHVSALETLADLIGYVDAYYMINGEKVLVGVSVDDDTGETNAIDTHELTIGIEKGLEYIYYKVHPATVAVQIEGITEQEFLLAIGVLQ